jgi:hypothetical protein
MSAKPNPGNLVGPRRSHGDGLAAEQTVEVVSQGSGRRIALFGTSLQAVQTDEFEVTLEG